MSKRKMIITAVVTIILAIVSAIFGVNYSERDVLCMAEQLAPIHNTKDIFWDISAKYVIASMIAYVMECFPKDQRNIAALA